MSFGNRQEALHRLARYNPAQVKAVLVPEPSNLADPAAMAVMVGVQNRRGLYRLGYVPRNRGAVEYPTAYPGRAGPAGAAIMDRKTNMTVKFSVDNPPRIANRSDALELLDILINTSRLHPRLEVPRVSRQFNPDTDFVPGFLSDSGYP
jgi:hypothetical protein